MIIEKYIHMCLFLLFLSFIGITGCNTGDAVASGVSFDYVRVKTDNTELTTEVFLKKPLDNGEFWFYIDSNRNEEANLLIKCTSNTYAIYTFGPFGFTSPPIRTDTPTIDDKVYTFSVSFERLGITEVDERKEIDIWWYCPANQNRVPEEEGKKYPLTINP